MSLAAENHASLSSSEMPTTYPGDLYVKNASKSFGVTRALDGVSFTGYFGEVHAIIGGNGCGKSTLAKVLAGVLPIDSGKVSIKGYHPSTPGESRAVGVSMVFQEVLVADESSVVDNLFIGSDGFFSKSMSDSEKADKAYAMMSELAGEPVDPLVPAGTLPLSIKAWITIARGLLCEPDVLILDESSAALDFDSTERLFNKIRELRDRGAAIIIVTHRIAELIRVSDRCTVMRDGKDVGVLEKEEITEDNLLRLMTGRAKSEKPSVGDAHKTTSTEVAVKTTQMKVWPDGAPVDFELLKGEIVGITGLDGHGQDDFVRILAGVKSASEGFAQVKIANTEKFFSIKSLEDAKANKIGFVSGDRKREGILPNLSIFENLLLPLYASHSKVPGARLIDWLGLKDLFEWEVERLAIKTGPKDNLITSLSGGNQQKVMLGRAFAQHPTTLVLLDPARGIDLHTKRDLYKQLREFADEGSSVIYMSSELEEFIGFCSRVLVFRNGSVFETFRDESIEAVGMLESMFGRTQGGEAAQPARKKVAAAEAKINSSLTPKKNHSSENANKSRAWADSEVFDEGGAETTMSKYNVSKYFNTEQQASDSNSARKESYSSSDESLFEGLLRDSIEDSALQRYEAEPKKESDTISTAQGIQYTDSDAQNFAALLESGSGGQSAHQNVKKSRNGSGNSGAYSDADEDSFSQLMASTNEEDETTASTQSASDRKPAKTDSSEIRQQSTSSSVEYSDKDLKKFESLMPG